MSTEAWLIVGVLVGAWLHKRAGRDAQAAQWHEDVPVNGTDFQGDWWQRLAGVDLIAAKPQDRNLANSTIADPGKVGQAELGVMPNWRGDL